jgi:rhodanese-related sulfurtransferase
MYNSISMPEFEQKIKHESVHLIDVREPDEFQGAHLAGSIHIPLNSLPSHLQNLDRSKDYYVMCYSGGRSTIACQFLSKQGFKVTNIMGGISAYRGEVEHGI